MQESALQALRTAVENFERPAFPCALIAGDVVILNLLEKLGYLSSGKVPVIFIDTFHLFQETHDFMRRLEVSLLSPSSLDGENICPTMAAHKSQESHAPCCCFLLTW